MPLDNSGSPGPGNIGVHKNATIMLITRTANILANHLLRSCLLYMMNLLNQFGYSRDIQQAAIGIVIDKWAIVRLVYDFISVPDFPNTAGETTG